MTKVIAVLAAVSAVGAVAASAPAATVLYEHTFSGSSSTNLYGTAVDVDNVGTPNDASWRLANGATAGTILTAQRSLVRADGSVVAMGAARDSAENRGGVYLPFNPVGGNIYELTATLNAPAGLTAIQNDWIALGFSQYDGGGPNPSGQLDTDLRRHTDGAVNGYAWMFQRQDGATANDSGFRGVNTGNPVDLGNPAEGAHVSTVRLDTTGNQWAVSFLIDGTQVGATSVYTTNPVINFVGISLTGGLTGSGAVDNFSLTLVPEPTALGVLGLAGMGLAARRRRA